MPVASSLRVGAQPGGNSSAPSAVEVSGGASSARSAKAAAASVAAVPLAVDGRARSAPTVATSAGVGAGAAATEVVAAAAGQALDHGQAQCQAQDMYQLGFACPAPCQYLTHRVSLADSEDLFTSSE